MAGIEDDTRKLYTAEGKKEPGTKREKKKTTRLITISPKQL